MDDVTLKNIKHIVIFEIIIIAIILLALIFSGVFQKEKYKSKPTSVLHKIVGVIGMVFFYGTIIAAIFIKIYGKHTFKNISKSIIDDIKDSFIQRNALKWIKKTETYKLIKPRVNNLKILL